MKILLTREGVEKKRENTGDKFDEQPAIKFLAQLFDDERIAEDTKHVS